jgi:hypothetical protein
MAEVRRLVRYLKQSKGLKLRLSGDVSEEEMTAYSDADWAEDPSDRKSSTGYICMMNGGTISWCSRKQATVARSSTESEYMALADTCQEITWLKHLASEFDVEVKVTVNSDSQSCIKAIENQKYSSRTKHIDVKYHYTREMVESKKINLEYCKSEDNVADILTKPLGGIKVVKLRSLAGLDVSMKKGCDNSGGDTLSNNQT